MTPKVWKRYAQLAQLLLRHGGRDWISPDRGAETPGAGARSPDESQSDLARDLEKMGPTFIKLGQLLSTRPDIVPPRHIASLERLQDDVEPFPGEIAADILRQEFGVGPERLYATFEEQPFAAASLAQVHRARLHDGEPVAVKIRRPGIREGMIDDLEALQALARFIERRHPPARYLDLSGVVEHFRHTILLELDFDNERANLNCFAAMLEDYPSLVLPRPVDDLCSGRNLTMSYIEGTPITRLSPVVLTEIDGAGLAREFFHAYLHQVLVEGSFHADPHPGNLLLTPDHRIGVLDLGMIGRFPKREQRELLKLLLAIAEADGSRASEIATGLGSPAPDFDRAGFERRISELVTRHANTELGDLDVGGVVLQICGIATQTRLRLPPTTALLGKTLLNLDKIGKTLDPTFDPHAVIREAAGEILERRTEKDSLSGQVLTTMLETREFAEKLPRQLARIVDHAAANRLRLRVDAFDQSAMIASIRNIANRITAGLVLAALIIGAALLMRVDTDFRLFGYPGIAMILFLTAAAGGFWLSLSVLLGDRDPGRSR